MFDDLSFYDGLNAELHIIADQSDLRTSCVDQDILEDRHGGLAGDRFGYDLQTGI